MNLLSKETLIGAASLGAGAVAAKLVHKKVLPLVPVAVFANPNVQNLTTLVLGVFTPMAVKGPIGKGLGAGMIAVSVAGLIDPLLSKAGITRTDTFLGGDVFLGNEASNSQLGANSDDFTSANQDYSASSAGEMEY